MEMLPGTVAATVAPKPLSLAPTCATAQPVRAAASIGNLRLSEGTSVSNTAMLGGGSCQASTARSVTRSKENELPCVPDGTTRSLYSWLTWVASPHRHTALPDLIS